MNQEQKPWWFEYCRNAFGIATRDANIHQFKALVAESRRLERENICKKLNELVKINADATAPADDYFTGMTNGLECAAACTENRTPNYIDVAKSVRAATLDEVRKMVEVSEWPKLNGCYFERCTDKTCNLCKDDAKWEKIVKADFLVNLNNLK